MPKSLREEVAIRAKRVKEYLMQARFAKHFKPEHLNSAVYSYLRTGGKSLRSAMLLLACGAVGGKERSALPAACGLEVYHTWTLVHDDILDNDDMRRGGLSVHEEFSKRARKEFGFRNDTAAHYGVSVAILAGDIQHAWAIYLFSELSSRFNVSEKVTLGLIADLENNVLNNLIAGELLDIQFAKAPFDSLNEDKISDMLWKKTGALYEFTGRAGAMIGLNKWDEKHPFAKSLSGFMSNCGMAFQLQDDILGVIGNEKKLGKPVGSDIREGKRTIILYHAWSKAGAAEKRQLAEFIGRGDLTPGEIQKTVDILTGLGGIDRARSLARGYIIKAKKCLSPLPPSGYRDVLSRLSDYLIEREM